MRLILTLLLYATTPHLVTTPGVINPAVTKEVACTTKWGLDERHVTLKMKQDVSRLYGVAWKDHARFEYDHLIPRELGGADDVGNLWPQPRFGSPNAKQKDQLENKLHTLVCSGHLHLSEAQDMIRADWVGAYKHYVTR